MKTKYNLKMKQTLMLGFMLVLGIFMMHGAIAVGVAAPYWDTEGNEKPLVLQPGESEEFNFVLQNPKEDYDVVFTANVVKGNDFVEFVSSEEEYFLPAGTDEYPVTVRVSVPETTPLGTVQKIKFDFLSKIADEESSQFGSGFGKSFDLIVQEKAEPNASHIDEEKPETSGTLNGYVFLILGIVVGLAIVGLIVYRSKKKV